MTSHYGLGYVTEKDLKSDHFFSEKTEYDVEKDKSSNVSILSDGVYDSNLIIKEKNRSFDKVVYESFMMDFWNNLLSLYSKENNLKLNSSESTDIIYDFNNRNSFLVMNYCPGIALKKIPYKRNDFVNFKGNNTHKSNVLSYHIGVLNKIKESELLLHSDYDDRHILFYHNPKKDINSLSVIDVENSKFCKKVDKILKESENLENLLKKHFPRDENEDFYYEGYDSIDSLFSRDDVFKKTEKNFNEKFKKNGEPYVNIDIYEQDINC